MLMKSIQMAQDANISCVLNTETLRVAYNFKVYNAVLFGIVLGIFIPSILLWQVLI